MSVRSPERRRGNTMGFAFFQVLVHCAGLRGAYGFLYFVCLHYLLFDPAAVRAADAYVRRRFPDDRWPRRMWRVYQLFVNQGKQLIDRYASTKGMMFDMTIKGYDEFCDLLHGGRGFVLVSAHIGNWQMAMTILHDLKKTVYLVMRPEDNPAVAASLKIGENGPQIRCISPAGYLGGMVEATNALLSGGVVCFMGDRSYGADSLAVSFLNGQALFPYGAFHLAASCQAPLVVLLSAKTAVDHYEIDTTKIFHPRYAPGRAKKTQLQSWVQKYANVLEVYLRKYPYQCFLFYDVWQREK